MKSVVIILLLVLSTFLAAAQNKESAFQFDPSVAVNIDLTKTSRFEFMVGQEDSEEMSRNRWKVRAGFSFRIKPIFRRDGDPEDDKRHLLVLRASYEYSRTKISGVTDRENRLILEATPRHRWPGRLIIGDRNRVEFRWINGQYSLRYRNQPRLDWSFRIDRFRLAPYASVEGYWDQRYKKWNQFKFTSGADIPIGKFTSVGVYYERRNCITCPARHINILGTSLNFYLNSKR